VREADHPPQRRAIHPRSVHGGIFHHFWLLLVFADFCCASTAGNDDARRGRGRRSRFLCVVLMVGQVDAANRKRKERGAASAPPPRRRQQEVKLKLTSFPPTKAAVQPQQGQEAHSSSTSAAWNWCGRGNLPHICCLLHILIHSFFRPTPHFTSIRPIFVFLAQSSPLPSLPPSPPSPPSLPRDLLPSPPSASWNKHGAHR